MKKLAKTYQLLEAACGGIKKNKASNGLKSYWIAAFSDDLHLVNICISWLGHHGLEAKHHS